MNYPHTGLFRTIAASLGFSGLALGLGIVAVFGNVVRSLMLSHCPSATSLLNQIPMTNVLFEQQPS